MKPYFSLIFCTFLLCTATAARPASLEGFLDIVWGESPNAVKAKMLARPGVTFVNRDSNARGDYLCFKGGTFHDEPAMIWELYFRGDKFSEGYVRLGFFKPSNDQKFEQLRVRLIEKYGEPSDDDDHRIEVWNFGGASPKTAKQQLRLLLNGTLGIDLYYTNLVGSKSDL